MKKIINETEFRSLYAEDTFIEDPVARKEAFQTFWDNLEEAN